MTPTETEVRAVLQRHLSMELPPEDVQELTQRLRFAQGQLELLHALPLEQEEEPMLSSPFPLGISQP